MKGKLALLMEIMTAPPRSRTPSGRNEGAKAVTEQEADNEDRSVSDNRIDPDAAEQGTYLAEQATYLGVEIFYHVRAISNERTRFPNFSPVVNRCGTAHGPIRVNSPPHQACKPWRMLARRPL